jgi:integrase
LTPEEVKRLLRVVKGSKFEVLYILAIITGMRQGELLGLKWGDIDLDEGTSRVRRTLWEGKITSPKTAKAHRSIRLTGLARGAHKQQQQKKKKKKNGSWEWVFPSRRWHPYQLLQPHKPLLAAPTKVVRATEDPLT